MNIELSLYKSSQKKLFTAILLAGGSGSRFQVEGLPKQFLEISPGVLVIEQSLKALVPFVSKVVVALPNHISSSRELQELNLENKLRQIAADNFCQIVFVVGGSSRQESCSNALKEVDSPYFLVHDAARPLVHAKDILNLLERVVLSGAAILAKPLPDTLKKVLNTVNSDKGANLPLVIEKTLPREELWIAETPQAFLSLAFKEALAAAQQNNFLATDDASLLENSGAQVEIVQSQYLNFKITTQPDLRLAKLVLQDEQGNELGQ